MDLGRSSGRLPARPPSAPSAPPPEGPYDPRVPAPRPPTPTAPPHATRRPPDEHGDAAPGPNPSGTARPALRPTVEELRLTAFRSYRRATLRLAPLTVLTGPAGSGRSNVLDALDVLARLALGLPLDQALDGTADHDGRLTEPVRGGLAHCPPAGSRGFQLGCAVATPDGTVRYDIAIATLPTPGIVRETLRGADDCLAEAVTDHHGAATLRTSWLHAARGRRRATADLAPDRPMLPQLPLRVPGATPAEERVLRATDAVVTALRHVFPLHPVPALMRAPVPVADSTLRPRADNLSAVVARMAGECRQRYGRLVRTLREASPQQVADLRVVPDPPPPRAAERVTLAVHETPFGLMPAPLLADGLLRHLAFATVLLTGPDLLAVDGMGVPDGLRSLTVAADDLDAGLDAAQTAALLHLAAEMTAKGHLRLLTTLHDPTPAARVPSARVVRCHRDPRTGWSTLLPDDPTPQ
ncbi:AAA family ATPase [Allostreptomyces psammosilenae]|uniref:Uncharacterized protein n=1 Tax=Allostreptomyces psammosilenae TaxID=1892865 RepID=A0A852ZL76_9ACTN|nr:ATP-binding protein [Allostreptomyces psammosilenae]NYI03159.1 hypothetical protein [Allostreptomyces psammosilenae]